MKKTLKIILVVIVSVILAAVIAVAVIWGGEIASVASVKQVGDNQYLYTMQYKARYDLDKVVENDIDSNAALLKYVVGTITKGLPIELGRNEESGEADHCTSFQARNIEGGYLYGRNYDFFKNPTLVCRSNPKDGYASISACDMAHFGYGMEKLPVSLKDRLLCLAAVYAPMDGMNEKGLCTSIMALPKQPARQDSGKHKVGTSILMRLFLDRCATVDEAIELVQSLDVNHDQAAGSGYHYMVADAEGNCAVIEFDLHDGWKTMIVRKAEDKEYMHVTNHLLSPKYYTTEPDCEVGNPHSKSWWRYEVVEGYLSERNGVVSLSEAQECLSLVHWKDLVWPSGMVEDTQFSNVYDQSSLTLSMRCWNDYDRTVTFDLSSTK